MSVPLLRQARLAQTLSAARRSISQCRRYAAAAVQPRHEPKPVPVAGPSRTDAPAALHAQVSEQDSKPQDMYSRVESYLAYVNASGIEPTLADLEQCKPVERPPLQSPKYVKAYNELVSSLCRSFTKEQLRKFLLEALGTSRHCATNRRKADYAESILEQLWKWPTLSELERAKRDKTEVVTKMLPVNASQLFLILGRDGTDLLRMSQDYDVHMSLRLKPMALRVEGTRGAVREVTEHILAMRQTFVEEIFELPITTTIPEDMVQRISRLAQAYLENVPSTPGKIRICAKDAQGLDAAKRLASRSIHEIEESMHTPLLTHLPAGTAAHQSRPLVLYPHAYAFYPYLSPRPLPVIMNTSGAFRLRRVGEWLKSGYQEDVDSTGGLAAEKGHILTESESSVMLRDILSQALPESIQTPRLAVQASLGHMLLTRVSKDQRATLVPPLTGDHPFGKIRKWISSNPVKMSFVPDLPLPLLNTAPAQQTVIHRLVYHSLSSSSDPSSRDSPVSIHLQKVISLEATLDDPRNAKREVLDSAQAEQPLESADEEAPQTKPVAPSVLVVSGTRYAAGVQGSLNLMMPDRPMDLQFTVSNTADLPLSSQPAELSEYARRLHAFLSGEENQPEQPTPPFIINHEGEKYLLHLNVSVRQSVEKVASTGRASLREEESGDSTRALCESALDLESNQKSMHCQVTCEDASDEASWKRFLTDCDRLSLLTHKSNTTSFLENSSTMI